MPDKIIIIKIIVLILSTVIYVSCGIFMTFMMDKYILYNFEDASDDKINRKTTFRHFIDLIIILSVVTLIGYITRNLCEMFFSTYLVFLNDYGFDYTQVKEISSGLYLNTTLFLFTSVLNSKVSILRNRFNSMT